MITDQFLQTLKQTTEARWQQRAINRQIYGFQFQPGTHWNPGLDRAAKRNSREIRVFSECEPSAATPMKPGVNPLKPPN
jgi:hypothetical protein